MHSLDISVMESIGGSVQFDFSFCQIADEFDFDLDFEQVI